MTITQHRWSIAVAWQNASAQQQRRGDDVVRFTLLGVAIAAVMTPYYVLSPANTIHRHSAGVTARVVHNAVSRLVSVISLLAAAAALVAMTTATTTIPIATMFALALVMLLVLAGGLADHYAAWKAPRGTHLLTDLIRDRDSTSGHSSELVGNIRRLAPDVVTGTCPNDKVWQAAYAGNADAIEPGTDDKIHFVLHTRT